MHENQHRAFVFIDLDSALRIKVAPWKDKKQEESLPWKLRCNHVIDTFAELQRRVTALLEKIRPSGYSTVVTTRIYHGWHRGKTATNDRRIWADSRLQFRAFRTSKASYLPDVEFGDRLLCGGPRMPLLDTLRNSDGRDRQKMVDTAVIADLLYMARSESSSFRKGVKPNVLSILIADDDDLLPGAFVAEAWGLPTYVARVTRKGESVFLQTQGMVVKV